MTLRNLAYGLIVPALMAGYIGLKSQLYASTSEGVISNNGRTLSLRGSFSELDDYDLDGTPDVRRTLLFSTGKIIQTKSEPTLEDIMSFRKAISELKDSRN